MSARKPLELAVYDLEAFPHLVAKARTATRRKRLTGPELAAEMWRSCVINGDGEVPFDERLVEWSRVEVWHRFATHPHYDEVEP